MILDDIFSWLHNGQSRYQVIPQAVYLGNVQKEAIDAEALLRTLLAKYHAIKFDSKRTPNEVSSALLDIKKQEKKIAFLQFCRSELQHQQEITQVELALNFIASNSGPEEYLDKLKKLYWAFLNYDEAKALMLLQEKASMLDQKIIFGLSSQKTAYYLRQFELLLQYQQNPMGIALFGHHYLADIEKFAALILYFLKQSIKPEALIQTGLLHQFLLYNITEIGFEDNEVKFFYDLVQEHEQGIALYQAADAVSLNTRGFESYSLTGRFYRRKTLRQAEILEPKHAFTGEIKNFKSLYLLFGHSFVNALIQCYARSGDSAAKDYLEQLLNQQFSNEQLQQYIQQIAVSHVDIFSVLTDLITDETFTELAEANVAEILYFVAYKPDLCCKVGDKEVEQYLQQCMAQTTTPYDVLPAFLFLLKTFSRVNSHIADLIFENILHVLVEHPQLLDDESVFNQIKKYPGKQRIIEKQFRETERSFTEFLMGQCGQVPFLIHHYHAIEDAWGKALAAVNLYHDIFEQSHTIPHDKYMLYGRIAEVLSIQQGANWSFADLVDILQIDTSLNPTEKTAYERTLTAILVALDQEKTRLAIIDILKEKYFDESRFNQLLFGLFNDAVERNNPGLIGYILNHCGSLVSKEMMSHAIEFSVACSQWDVIDVFLQQASDGLAAKTLAVVVTNAVKQGETQILHDVFKNHSTQLKKEDVHRAFSLAANHNQLEALDLLVNYYDFLIKDEAMMAKGLGVALACDHIDAAQFIIDIKDSSVVQGKIESLLKKAFQDRNIKSIQFLISLNVNQPSRQCIERLFERACAVGNLMAVQCVIQLNKIKPCKGSMDKSLINAAKRGHFDVVAYLCEHTGQFDLKQLKSAQKKARKANFDAVGDYLERYIAAYEMQPSIAVDKKRFKTPLLTNSIFGQKTESVNHHGLMAYKSFGQQK